MSSLTESDGEAKPEPRPIEELIMQRVAESADRWFPGQRSSRPATVTLISRRPSCSLFAVRVGGADSKPQILAKVRRDVPSSGSALLPHGAGRPRLRSQALTAQQLTTMEFDGLRTISAAVGADHPEFGVVRPLEDLPGRATLLMSYVDASTLRRHVLNESRLSPRGPAARRTSAASDVWHHVGSWLRAWQQSTDPSSRPAQQSTRQEVVKLFQDHHEYLARRAGHAVLGDIALRGAELAGEVLPQALPLAVGHGDYAPRNMFFDAGRLTVFDPMPRWSVPRYEDLCRCLVGLRLIGLQVHTHGAAFSQAEIERHEAAAIAGFVATETAPLAQLRCYQLLILLDKWSALVESSRLRRGWPGRIQRVSLAVANRYIAGQARRLVDLSRQAAG